EPMGHELRTATKQGDEIGDAAVPQFHGFHCRIASPILFRKTGKAIAHVFFNRRRISVLKMKRHPCSPLQSRPGPKTGSSPLNRGEAHLSHKWGSRHTPLGMLPHTTRRTIMDPTTTFCPNGNCPARGQTGQGNIGIHSRKEQRFICHACDKTFSATTGTVFYRLRTSAETVVIIVTLLAHGCPVQAIVAAFGFDERTVADWWARSGRQSQAVQEY